MISLCAAILFTAWYFVDASNNTFSAGSKTETTTEVLHILENFIKKNTVGMDYLGELPSLPATSCQQLAELRPNATSGFYWIRPNRNSQRRLYCDMNKTECGGGVWTRILNVDMTLPCSNCPGSLNLETSPKRSCRKRASGHSVYFSAQGVPYKNICGKIIGYQKGSPDAFAPYDRNKHYSINNCLVDGIILTTGYPRHHIWTFAAQQAVGAQNAVHGCPCKSNSWHQRYRGLVPSVMGDSYFCETGAHTGRVLSGQVYTEHPLWDGIGFGRFPDGCSGTRSPWFVQKFACELTSSVEMRICLDEGIENEDILIEQMYLYVQ